MEKRGKGISAGWIILIIFLAVIVLCFVSCTILLFSGEKEKSLGGNVALIQIKGTIAVEKSSMFGAEGTSSTEIISFLKDADRDSSIKAVVLEINSGGGSAVASKEIADAVKRLSKPSYAVIREIGASGAYWIASACDRIIANEMSITGSVGVLSSYLQFSGLLETYNISYERLVAGKYKDMGSPLKNLTFDERAILQEKIGKIHTAFVNEVAKNRNLSYDAVQRISSAEFYLGTEALELGLVDALGDMDSAEGIIQSDLNLTKVEFSEYKKPKGLIELLSGVFAENSFYVGRGIGSMLFDAKNQFGIFT